MDIGFVSVILLIAGILAAATVLATIVAKTAGARIVARAEERVGPKGVDILLSALLAAALTVMCCGTIGSGALPMISVQLTRTPTPESTAVPFAVDMSTRTSAVAAAKLVTDILYREDPVWREDLRQCGEEDVDTVISRMVLSSPAPADVLDVVRDGLAATGGVTITAENLDPAAMLRQVHGAEPHYVRYSRLLEDGPRYVDEVDLGLSAEWTVHRFRVERYTIHDSGRHGWPGGWLFVLVQEEPARPPLLGGFKVAALFFAEGQ
jgi:hypothetical protein